MNHFLFTERRVVGGQQHFFSAGITGDGFGWEWYLSVATWQKGEHENDRVEWKDVPVPGRGTYERVVEAAYEALDLWAAGLWIQEQQSKGAP